MKKQLLTIFALLLVVTAFAQDDQQTFTRKVLIEQFTGADCRWCPSGAERIASAISGNNNVVWIKYHAGFSTDFLTNDIATAMTCFYGGNLYAPAVMFDRTHFSPANPAPVMSIGDVSDIRYYISQSIGVTTTCKVYTPDIAYNPDTRHLSGTVSGRFGDNSFNDSTRLIVFIVEDSLIGRQVDYYNGVLNNFVHMGTVRDAVTDMWGTPVVVDTESDNTFSYNVDYTLPDDYVYKNCRVVAIVYHYDPSDVNNCAVLNAAQSTYFDRALGIGEVSQDCDVRLYPNPAHDMVVIQLPPTTCQVSLLDAAGRTISTQSVSDSYCQFGLQSLPAGLYLVRVATSDGIATRQLIKR